MELKTADLKKFKAASAHIKQNGILPILDYLKFDKGTVTKNNLNEFVVYDMPGAEPMLVEERILFSFIDNTTSDTITLEQRGKQIVISAGKNKSKSDAPDTNDYPVNELPDTKGVSLSEDLICAIRTAAAFAIDTDSDIFTNFVFVGVGNVTATDNFIAYIEPVGDIPEIVLRRSTALAIGKLSDLTFSETEKYHFFSTPGITYGFIKSELKWRDLSVIAKNKPEGGFTTSKAPIIQYCNRCISASPSKTLTASLVMNGSLHLAMNDNSYNVEETADIEATGSSAEEFSFNPVYMQRLLKSVPGDTLTFTYSGKKSYFITGDSEFTAFIAEMQK